MKIRPVFLFSNIFRDDGCKFGTRCRYSHDFTDEQPAGILQQYKIDPQENVEELIDRFRKKVNAQYGIKNQGGKRGNEEEEEEEDWSEEDKIPVMMMMMRRMRMVMLELMDHASQQFESSDEEYADSTSDYDNDEDNLSQVSSSTQQGTLFCNLKVIHVYCHITNQFKVYSYHIRKIYLCHFRLYMYLKS